MTTKAPAFVTVEELVEPFGWLVECPNFTDVERRSLQTFLQVMHEVVHRTKIPGIGQTMIPKAFWMSIQMPSRVLAANGFAKINDAKALAVALCRSGEQLVRWQEIVKTGDVDAYPHFVLELTSGMATGLASPFGDVYVDSDADSGEVTIWFGRKAGRAPALSDDRTWMAIEKLFGITDDPALEPDRPARDISKAAPAKATTKKPKTETKPAAVRKAEPVAVLQTVAIADILPSKENHRKAFDQNELKELADSIKAHGVLQPLLLREITANDRQPSLNYPEKFVIIAGERRYRAAKLAGLTEVPAQIVQKSGVSESLAMLEENIRRVDLNPIERAEAIKRLMDEHKLTQKEVGQMVGVQQGQISNELRLLNLPESLQKLVADGAIAPTLIRTVLPVAEFPAVVQEIAQAITEAVKEGRPIEVRLLEETMRTATLKHSRPMRYENNWNAWAPPNPKDRHFSKVTPEQEKALNVHELKFLQSWEGQKRCFNVELFNELNKAPLAARKKKHEEHKAKRNPSQPEKGSKSKEPFQSRYNAEYEIDCAVSVLLADAIEQSRNKDAVRQVCLAVSMITEGQMVDRIVERKGWSPDPIARQLLPKLAVTPAALDQLLRSHTVAFLRDDPRGLSTADLMACGKALGVDLSALWKPTEEFVATLTDHGRQLLAETLPGQLPAFLRPLFGLKDEKPAKAKKGKAA